MHTKRTSLQQRLNILIIKLYDDWFIKQHSYIHDGNYFVPPGSRSQPNIKVIDDTEMVNNFTYLGSIVEYKSGHRTQLIKRAMGRLIKIQRDKTINKKVQIRHIFDLSIRCRTKTHWCPETMVLEKNDPMNSQERRINPERNWKVSY